MSARNSGGRSKRQERSDRAAQLVCRELRHQMSNVLHWDGPLLADCLVRWMRHTGLVKYQRPTVKGKAAGQ